MMRPIYFVIACVVLCNAKRIYDDEKYNEIPGYNIRGLQREFRDQDRDIHRPCPYYDLLCIRRYLARHSECKIAQGPVPDPLYRAQSNLYFPSQNISVTQEEIFIGGLNGIVNEFYVNREDELTILSVEFRNVTLKSTRAVFRYLRRGQEPTLTNSSTTEFIPSFVTTTVFRGINDLKLANSESSAFINQMLTIIVDPRAGVSDSDPTVPARFANFMANPNIVSLEAFLTAGPFYAATYIQYNICDFGLKLN